MLYYAFLFLVLSLVAAWLGFAAAAGTAATIAKVCFVIFLVIAVVAFFRRGSTTL